MADVFLSYARDTRQRIEQIGGALEAAATACGGTKR
jgi:hypothetical protein